MASDLRKRPRRAGRRSPQDVVAVVAGLLLLTLLLRDVPGRDQHLSVRAEPAPPPEDAQPPQRAQPSNSPVDRFKRSYGAHPVHLLMLVASLALTAYAVVFVVSAPNTVRIAIWFVAAVIAHDLILFPVYAAVDRTAVSALSRRHRIPLINHLRLPAMASGLLLLIFFPAILQQGDATYFRASGLHEGSAYLTRWLLLTADFFLVSAIAYLARAAASTRTARSR
jgi:hypothetical protein